MVFRSGIGLAVLLKVTLVLAQSTASSSKSASSVSTSIVSASASTTASATTSAASIATPTSLTSSWAYSGCYSDPLPATGSNASTHALSSGYEATNNMTQSICAAFCQQGGWGYAAIQYSSQCTCGTTLRSTAVKSSESNCQMGCSGETGTACGGNYYMTLFENAALLAGSSVSASSSMVTSLRSSSTSSRSSSSSSSSSSAAPTSSVVAASKSSSHTGAIVGAVVGCLTGLVILGAAIFLFRRKKRSQERADNNPFNRGGRGVAVAGWIQRGSEEDKSVDSTPDQQEKIAPQQTPAPSAPRPSTQALMYQPGATLRESDSSPNNPFETPYSSPEADGILSAPSLSPESNGEIFSMRAPSNTSLPVQRSASLSKRKPVPQLLPLDVRSGALRTVTASPDGFHDAYDGVEFEPMPALGAPVSGPPASGRGGWEAKAMRPVEVDKPLGWSG